MHLKNHKYLEAQLIRFIQFVLNDYLKSCTILRDEVLLLLLPYCQNKLHQSHLAAKSAGIVEVADKFLGFAAVWRILCL